MDSEKLVVTLALVLFAMAIAVPFVCIGMLKGQRIGNERMIDRAVIYIIVVCVTAEGASAAALIVVNR